MPEVTISRVSHDIILSREGTEQMIAAIDASKVRARNLTQPYKDFQPFWQENERTLFAAQGIPSWPSLSPAYAARKARIFPGKTILRRTDRLFLSLTAGGSDSMYLPGPRTLLMGTTTPYAKYHTTGTGRMPARPHVDLLPEYFQMLNGLIFQYVSRPFER